MADDGEDPDGSFRYNSVGTLEVAIWGLHGSP